MVVTARTVRILRGSEPQLILPADPNRISLLVKTSFLTIYLADNREALTTELTVQQAFYLRVFTNPIELENYTGALYARTESFVPHATTAAIVAVQTISKGSKK